MIGSHDSYTYLKARKWYINLISQFWRCQDIDIVEQYKLGVRFFDIRVFRDKDKKRNVWRCAHGPAEFSQIFTSLRSICNYFTNTLAGSNFRIWMEKGTDEEWELFKKEITPLIEEFPNLLQIVRKKPEIILYQNNKYPKLEYLACKIENPKNFIKGFYSKFIKNYAKKHNYKVTEEMIKDPNVCYFMDYVELSTNLENLNVKINFLDIK